MIGTIRKHSQFLWVFIIAGTIIAFVVFFLPGENPMDYFTGSSNQGERYGKPLTREDRLAARRDAHFDLLIQYGRVPEGFPFDGLVERRLVGNSLVKLHGIKVSDEVMKAGVRRTFSDREGKPSQAHYDGFLQMIARANYTELDAEEWIRNTLAIEHLQRVYTTSGQLVSSRAAELFIRHENEQAEAEFVFLPETNFLSQVKFSTNDIATYFTNNVGSFRIPERVVVNYVEFDYANSNYLAAAETNIAANTNLQALIDKEYENRGTNNFRNAEGKVLPKEEAAKKIRQEFVEEEAGKIGEDKARLFANEVFKLGNKAEYLFKVANEMGYEVKESKPFTELDGPKEFDAPGGFARVAFGLSSEEPLASPIRGVDGTYVIAFNRRVASEIPSLEVVRDDVIKEYKNFKSDELLREAGKKLAETIEQGLKAGKLFADIVKQENLKLVVVPTFSRMSRSIPQVEDFGVTVEEFVTAAMELEPGSASGFRSARDGGYIIFLKKRIPVSDEQVAEGLERYVTELRASRQGVIGRAWMEYEDIMSGAAAERAAAEQRRQQREAEDKAREAAEAGPASN